MDNTKLYYDNLNNFILHIFRQINSDLDNIDEVNLYINKKKNIYNIIIYEIVYVLLKEFHTIKEDEVYNYLFNSINAESLNDKITYGLIQKNKTKYPNYKLLVDFLFILKRYRNNIDLHLDIL